MDQLTLSNVQDQLIQALEKSKTATKAVEDAEAKIQPLREKAVEAQKHVSELMAEFNKLTGAVSTPAKKSRGTYNQTPESKVKSQYKRSYTRAINNGSTETEAKKIAKEAQAALAQKLGVPVPK